MSAALAIRHAVNAGARSSLNPTWLYRSTRSCHESYPFA